ncbi:PREDICTED: cyclic AMP-dependent transcription factor ATF-3 isoform X2 [Calidris pugnax]|uniref:cyclic AMP-dependent transcription factor ATF-3 isoform X2 n=1 Tax=Calidris pugnax TaxID=198806 RepID=UPI00071D8D16|nr:PREDICTED: cyclic AMP-dependent transcription factor ATF-3 isoform X2 [Calidris pugnax]XP_021143650.1 cyclic AMP-dependent transcription factor ATF-3 isoform X2 [Columba livia]
MMVQHSGQVSALEVSASAIVPTLSPAGSLGFDDFTNLTPLVKEELRFAIQNKRQSHRMSSTLDTVTVSERPIETSIMKTEESEKLETINAELKAQIEELKNEKQHLIYMLNLHRPTCIVRAQNGRTPEDERNLFIQQIKEGTLQG